MGIYKYFYICFRRIWPLVIIPPQSGGVSDLFFSGVFTHPTPEKPPRNHPGGVCRGFYYSPASSTMKS